MGNVVLVLLRSVRCVCLLWKCFGRRFWCIFSTSQNEENNEFGWLFNFHWGQRSQVWVDSIFLFASKNQIGKFRNGKNEWISMLTEKFDVIPMVRYDNIQNAVQNDQESSSSWINPSWTRFVETDPFTDGYVKFTHHTDHSTRKRNCLKVCSAL